MFSLENRINHPLTHPPPERPMLSASSHVVDAIKENQARIAAIDAEVEGLYELIAQRKAARVQILDTIERQKSSIAPIGHLPFEILGMIFLHFMDIQRHDVVSPLGDGRLTSASVLPLVQTCRQWKTVAYGTPGVWSYISVVLGSAKGERSPQTMEPMFKRVGAHPLVFKLNVRTPWLDEDDVQDEQERRDRYEKEVDHFLEMLERLNPNFKSVHIQGVGPFSTSRTHRWRSFLGFIEYLATHPQATRSMTSFSLRPSTFFSSGQPFTGTEAQIVGTAFPTFKALTTLEIPAGLLQPSCTLVEQIKDLQITNNCPAFGHEFTDIVPTIQACSTLRSLTVRASRFSDQQPIVKVTLPGLRRLVMDCCDDVDAVFGRLQVPMLQALTLVHDGHYQQRETLYRLAFKTLFEQETGTPRLTKLDILGYNIPGKTLVWVWERLPTLLELTIHGHHKLGTVLLEAFCKPPTARKGWLCPNLQRLEVERCYKIVTVQFTQIIDARVAGSIQQAGASSGKGKRKEQKTVAPLKSVMFNGMELVGREREPVAATSNLMDDGSDGETDFSD